MKKSIDIDIAPLKRTAIERLCDQIMRPMPPDPMVKYLAPLNRDQRRDLCDCIMHAAMLDVHAVRQKTQDDISSLAESVARLTRMLEEAAKPIEPVSDPSQLNIIPHTMPLSKEEP
jgi:hypothetical protein